MQDVLDRLTEALPEAKVTFTDDATTAVLIQDDAIFIVHYDMETRRVFTKATIVDRDAWETIANGTLRVISRIGA